MNDQLNAIKNWLGTGSINIFGLPYSGKDTIGVRLAEALGAKFLSSGLILRHHQASDKQLSAALDAGHWAPTDKFRDIVLPYFSREDLRNLPLILSGIGRWSGEEHDVMRAATDAGHPIRAVVLLNISESDIKIRWEVAKTLDDRGIRPDDRQESSLDQRIAEFRDKTMPVIRAYQDLGLLLPVRADATKGEVFAAVVDALYDFSTSPASASL